jgi:hypothetical protein
MILEKICSLKETTTPLRLVEMTPPSPIGDDLGAKVVVINYVFPA